MNYFKLPNQTKVNRVVPKNAFDKYTNTKQKKLFIDKVLRITWTHKLSADTINLEGEDIQELQLFRVELKELDTIAPVLEIIDKAIPYPIIFWVQYDNQVYLSTTAKHPHPLKENHSVIDWTFQTEWFDQNTEQSYQLNLKNNLDAVYKDFCVQLSGKPEWKSKSMAAIVQQEQEIDGLEKAIKQLKSQMKGCKQFSQKVELNIKVREKEQELKRVKELGLKFE